MKGDTDRIDPGPRASDNPLIRKLASGSTCLCMPIRFSRLGQVAHMARAAGFDAVYMDMEHSTLSAEQVSRLALTAAGQGVVPLARVPSHAAHEIVRILEGGVLGVIVPHVHTAEQARGIADGVRFRPLGHRATAGPSVSLGYAPLPADEAGHRLNTDTLLTVMIESLHGLDNADAIASVPGIDMLLVGTGDLSAEMGLHGDPADPKILAAYETVATACRRHGKWLGVAGIKGDTPVLSELHHLGARFLSVRTDETIMLSGMIAENDRMRKLFASLPSKARQGARS